MSTFPLLEGRTETFCICCAFFFNTSLHAERSRRGDADLDLMDNNVLLFGRWYRKLAVQGPPQMAHLRQFIMDRKAYWGDEIALRVFAGASYLKPLSENPLHSIL
jgi:hypothetical protein